MCWLHHSENITEIYCTCFPSRKFIEFLTGLFKKGNSNLKVNSSSCLHLNFFLSFSSHRLCRYCRMHVPAWKSSTEQLVWKRPPSSSSSSTVVCNGQLGQVKQGVTPVLKWPVWPPPRPLRVQQSSLSYSQGSLACVSLLFSQLNTFNASFTCCCFSFIP